MNNKEMIYENLIEICGKKKVSDDLSLLKSYSSDLSFTKGKIPKYIVWPINTQQVEKVVKLANTLNFSIVPVSSSSKYRHHGDTIPKRDDSIILNLSKMKKILSIDRKNRVVMVEPGVTFADLIPKLRRKGLKLLTPLSPTASKSVLASALEREPITIPRYQWDSSDPLLCTEVIFGSGDLFRTGTAAGPGTIKEQQKSGQAQVNPMGPTQFSPFRIIQGAQGSIGVITWASLKLELIPSIQKVFHLQSENIHELLELQHDLIKYRLCDELFILNNLNLACLVKNTSKEIVKLAKSLTKWNLIFIITGRGKLSNDKISYLEGDIYDVMKELNLEHLNSKPLLNDIEILNALNQTNHNPWRMRFKGGFQDIFFISNYEKVPEFISLVEKEVNQDLGIYIQTINQGTSYHCEFDIFYNPEDQSQKEYVKGKFLEISTKLMDSGAFFSRPYGLWAKYVYERQSDDTILALKKVKRIFDPKNILNPGVLCFNNLTNKI